MEPKDKKHPTPSKNDRPIQAEAYPFIDNVPSKDSIKNDPPVVDQEDLLKRYS